MNDTYSLAEKLQLQEVEVEYIGLKYDDKEKLNEVIEQRVMKRIEAGAIQEVEQLLNSGYSEHDAGLRTIGYQQIIKFLKHEITKEKAIQDWITKEKQYAKRQETFMKKDKNITWKIISE